MLSFSDYLSTLAIKYKRYAYIISVLQNHKIMVRIEKCEPNTFLLKFNSTHFAHRHLINPAKVWHTNQSEKTIGK